MESNKTKLIVVRGYQETGKTTTIWMVFLELVRRGAIVKSFLDTETKTTTYPATLPPQSKRNDFEAELDWNGISIVIFSYGDVYNDVKNKMEQILPTKPDYIICSASIRYWAFCAWNLFEQKYTNTMYERVSFWSEKSADPKDEEIVKRPTVKAIINYMP